MSCWDVLGIEPTRNASAIQDAYSQQVKFANRDEAEALQRALNEALAEAGFDQPAAVGRSEAVPVQQADESNVDAALSAQEHQIVREVVLQVRALLNDPVRASDVAVWRAVLTEPPADQQAMKVELGAQLEGQLRPMAKQGGLPTDVAGFLGHWFGWEELSPSADSVAQPGQQGVRGDLGTAEEELDPVSAAERESMKSFWPAVIGWIVGLVVLTSLFSTITGQ